MNRDAGPGLPGTQTLADLYAAPPETDARPPGAAPSREEIFGFLRAARKRGVVFDVAVVGGGIHGAAFARLSAFNGLRTVLFEAADYASVTSGRSSKMAHGGLRYLASLDVRQVVEGVRSREELFSAAPHLARPHPFLVPVRTVRERLTLGAGLTLYDFFLRDRTRRHRWIPAGAIPPGPYGPPAPGLAGCYEYTDGLMDDVRLVVETIVAARQEGAVCVNYARVVSASHSSEGPVEVGVTDVLTGEKAELLAGVVVDCAGPFAGSVGRLRRPDVPVRWSRGTHLLFDRPWPHPALFVPAGGPGRYYFVWPYRGGTMAGTTEREVDAPEADPVPDPGEVNEILDRLSRDLPAEGLGRESLYYGFTGVRTLPVRGSGGPTDRLSRRHVWRYAQGILSLYGGKYTTAAWTAWEGLREVYRIAGLPGKPVPLGARPLPGARIRGGGAAAFLAAAAAAGAPPEAAVRAVGRFGARVGYLTGRPELLTPVTGTGGPDDCLAGELFLVRECEQPVTAWDVLGRRLGWEHDPGAGLSSAARVAGAVFPGAPPEERARLVGEYAARVARARAAVGVRDDGPAS